VVVALARVDVGQRRRRSPPPRRSCPSVVPSRQGLPGFANPRGSVSAGICSLAGSALPRASRARS
jgi:hypothetical protein